MVLNFNDYTGSYGSYFPAILALAHELEHGRQFLDGEIDYYLRVNGVTISGEAHDRVDEYKAINVQELSRSLVDLRPRSLSEIEAQRKLYDRLKKGPVSAPEWYKDNKIFQEGIINYKSIFNYAPTRQQLQQKEEQSGLQGASSPTGIKLE